MIKKRGYSMRVVLIAIFLFTFSIVSIPLYAMAWQIGKKDEKLKVRFAQNIVSRVFKIILLIAGAKVECKGLENVPTDRAILYVSNHRSYLDILTSYTTVPTLTSFVSKKEIQKFPCVSSWMRILKCLFLDRENTKEGLKTILQGIEQLKQGYSIFIMPEGTRSHGDNLLPFHAGSFKLATKSNAVIVPVAMKSTDKVLRNRHRWFHRTKIQIQYGDPIYMETLTKEEQKMLHVITKNIIQEMLDKM